MPTMENGEKSRLEADFGEKDPVRRRRSDDPHLDNSQAND